MNIEVEIEVVVGSGHDVCLRDEVKVNGTWIIGAHLDIVVNTRRPKVSLGDDE